MSKPTSVGEVLGSMTIKHVDVILQSAPSEPTSTSEQMLCVHVPERFQGKTLADWDVSPGPYAVKMLGVIRRIISGEIASGLLGGPIGAGKSLAAAIIANELSRPLHMRVDQEEARQREARIAATDAVPPEGVVRNTSAWWHWQSERDQPMNAAEQAVNRAERALERDCPTWLGVPQMLARLRREMSLDRTDGSEEVRVMTSSPGLLVIDDLGASRNTEWAIQTLHEIVASRYDAMRPTLVTTNLTAQQLVDGGLERIVSRLADGGALVSIDKAADYRMKRRQRIA